MNGYNSVEKERQNVFNLEIPRRLYLVSNNHLFTGQIKYLSWVCWRMIKFDVEVKVRKIAFNKDSSNIRSVELTFLRILIFWYYIFFCLEGNLPCLRSTAYSSFSFFLSFYIHISLVNLRIQEHILLSVKWWYCKVYIKIKINSSLLDINVCNL